MSTAYGDRWEVVGTLGEGGQGVTFLVKDATAESDARFALKRLRNYKRVARFETEVEAISRLDHPGIVKLVDAKLDTDPAYLVTEYCEGGSLAKARPFWHESPVVALRLFQDVCAAIAHAHANGVIHRDLKPANVFLRGPSGPAVVGDFGLAFLEGTSERVTDTQEVVGPRTFAAPELEDGRLENVTPKCDTYSLGKLLYWMISRGSIFSREKHREEPWDLKGRTEDSAAGWRNVYLEHVNRLLDLMIVLDPERRRGVPNILQLAKLTTRLVEKEFNPVSRVVPQQCTYCGQGYYRLTVQSTGGVEDFGIMARGTADWRVLVCSTCGHVQLFRVESIQAKQWWE